MPFSFTKWLFQKIFGKNHQYYFHLPIDPFQCVKFQKHYSNITRVTKMHFWAQNGLFAPSKNFLGKIIYIIFIYLLAPFIVKTFKKFLQRIESSKDEPFSDPIQSIISNKNLFRKPVNKSCSFHSCLSTFQKSKSDINLSIKYWRLRITEISLAKRLFRTKFFPRKKILPNVKGS